MSKSIFDKITPEQWDAMNQEMGWGVEPYSAVDDQTVMFWHLQLQFMQMQVYHLGCTWNSVTTLPTYCRNEHTTKACVIALKALTKGYLTDKDRECLATHISIQLSGIEE